MRFFCYTEEKGSEQDKDSEYRYCCGGADPRGILQLRCLPQSASFRWQKYYDPLPVADRFAALGVIDENTKRYYNHFAHNCGMIYDEVVPAAEKYGFGVSYDGLEVEF